MMGDATMSDSPSNMTPEEALEALRWQVDMGIDEAISDVPVNRYSPAPFSGEAQPAAKPEPAASPVAAPASEPRAISEPAPITTPVSQPAQARPEPENQPLVPADGAREAIAAAEGVNSIEELRQRVEAFNGCALKLTATNTVFADGNPSAPLMLIGEAPGIDEDRQGLPFVGASGQLLDRILAAIGCDRSNVYISNILFWRPPGNRTPTPAETASCLPFVQRHIELAAPKVLVFLGGSSAKTMLDRHDVGIMKLRGQWYDYTSSGLSAPIPAMPTFHPAFLLRRAGQKREVWKDFLAVEAKLKALS